MTEKKQWYLLRVDVPIDSEIAVTVKPERLMTKTQALEVLKNF